MAALTYLSEAEWISWLVIGSCLSTMRKQGVIGLWLMACPSELSPACPEELRGTGSPGNWPLPQKNLGYAEQDKVTFLPVPAATAHLPCLAPASLLLVSAISFLSLSFDWNLFSDLGLVASLCVVPQPRERLRNDSSTQGSSVIAQL